jgi:hypothetical protein
MAKTECTWEEALAECVDFITGSQAWTPFLKHSANRVTIENVRKAINVRPLEPQPYAHMYPCKIFYVSPIKSAYRNPVDLFYAWLRAAGNAGRIPSLEPARQCIVARGDGLKDKVGLYHLGFILGDDVMHQSAYAQRDIIVGHLDEENQFAAFILAKALAELVAFSRRIGCAFLHTGDYNHLLCMSRGFSEHGRGFARKDANQSMLFFVLVTCSCQVHHVVLFGTVRLRGARNAHAPTNHRRKLVLVAP